MLHIRNVSTSVTGVPCPSQHRPGATLSICAEVPFSELPLSVTAPFSITRWEGAVGLHDNHGHHQPMYVPADVEPGELTNWPPVFGQHPRYQEKWCFKLMRGLFYFVFKWNVLES